MAEPPPFFSLRFHLEFLPAVIRERLRPPASRGGFVHSAVLEFSLMTGVCALMLAFGLPGLAGPEPTVLAALLTLIGAGGILAMLAVSLRSTWGEPLSYEAFEPGVFLFVIVLGATVGLWTGFLAYDDRGQLFHYRHTQERALLTLGGTVLGYFLGIPAALWLQKLGPLRGMVAVWALPGIIGLIVTDLVILWI